MCNFLPGSNFGEVFSEPSTCTVIKHKTIATQKNILLAGSISFSLQGPSFFRGKSDQSPDFVALS